MNIKCTACGTEHKEGTFFCTKCGSKLSQPQAIKESRLAEPQTINDMPFQPKKSRKKLIIALSTTTIVVLAAAAAAWIFLVGFPAKNSDTPKSSEKENQPNQEKYQNEDVKDTEKKKDLQKENDELLVKFVEENLIKQDETGHYGNAYYQFRDTSILPADTQYSEYSYIDGYQAVDVNFDGTKELLLRMSDEVPNYAFICYVNKGKVELSPQILIDNQGSSVLEYGQAVLIYENLSDGNKRAFISGGDGSGADVATFMDEIKEDFTVFEQYSYLKGGEIQRDMFEIQGQSVSEKEFDSSLALFQKENKFVEAYEYYNIADDIAQELSMLLGLTAEEETEPQEWADAYKEFIESFRPQKGEVNDSRTDNGHFQLGYVNDDDIPELFIATGSSHSNSVLVCTYYNHKVCQLGYFGSNGTFSYRERANIIHDFYGGMGNAYTAYYRFERGTAVKIESLEMTERQEDDRTFAYDYSYNNQNITKEEYEKYEKKFSEKSMTEIAYGDMPVISSDNIKNILKTFAQGLTDEQAESSAEQPGQPESNAPIYTTEPLDPSVSYKGDKVLELSRAEASSVLSEQLGNDYEPSNVLDNSADTAWAEGAAGDGTQQWIKVYLKEEQVVSAIGILNGYGKSESLYNKNARAKTLQLEFSDGSTQQIHLSDNKLDVQKVSLVPTKTTYVKLTILETYSGNTYEDLCIGKILCYE